jgi:catechol 2,3-dioxygenase-like lactoylglutathione lyase family enzyme
MAFRQPTKGFDFNHVGFRVADLDKSIDFYSDKFAMKELSRMDLDTVTIVLLRYADSADPSVPVLAREGVLELVLAKV